jgi:hypothetical protein
VTPRARRQSVLGCVALLMVVVLTLLVGGLLLLVSH